MGLLVAFILLAPNGDQYRSIKCLMHYGHRIHDRKCVSVEEHDEIVRLSFCDDLGRQKVEFARVSLLGRDHPIKFVLLLPGDRFEICHHPVPLVHMASQVGELDIDPLVRLVVNRGYVNHDLDNLRPPG